MRTYPGHAIVTVMGEKTEDDGADEDEEEGNLLAGRRSGETASSCPRALKYAWTACFDAEYAARMGKESKACTLQ